MLTYEWIAKDQQAFEEASNGKKTEIKAHKQRKRNLKRIRMKQGVEEKPKNGT